MYRFAASAVFLSMIGCQPSVPPGNGPDVWIGDDTAAIVPTRIDLGTPETAAAGVFDASLASDGERLWMSYSAVNPSDAWPEQNHHAVSTRLARSEDGGASWTDVGVVINPTVDVTLPLQEPLNAGTWHHEVSDLVFDPTAAATERWKLVWHHYLLIDGERRFEHGWLAFAAAATPEGLATAPETKLLVASGYDPSNDDPDGPTRPPVGGPPMLTMAGLDASLASCAAVTEPGMLATPEALYLSLLCANPVQPRHDIVLLACDAPCDGDWRFVQILMTEEDARAIGAESFSAPTLFEDEGGARWLFVSPVSSAPFANAYNGCLAFEFQDIAEGRLEATASLSVQGDSGSFNGACDVDTDSPASGVIYGQAFPDDDEIFQMFASGVMP